MDNESLTLAPRPYLAHDAPDASGESSTSTAPNSLSKNAQKRLLKAQRRAEIKVARKARDKELKAQKKRERLENEAQEEAPKAKRPRVEPKPLVQPFNARVVVDLGFDQLMTEKETVSLCSQLGHTYSLNRKASKPFSSLLFTSLSGRVKQHLDVVGQGAYKRWRGVEFWEESYDHLWRSDEGSTGSSSEITEQLKVIYLTADSTDELDELREGETYIIGGIVDRNRYKNLCLEKGREQGIRTARLPIGKYLAELTTRKVLTVNQVFDILLRWVETRDWQSAIKEVMPKRKLKKESRGVQFGEEEGEEEDGE